MKIKNENTSETYRTKSTIAQVCKTIMYYYVYKYKRTKHVYNIFRIQKLQVFATIAQSFLLVGLGMELGMPTVVIQQLYQNSDSKFSLTLTEISWYG